MGKLRMISPGQRELFRSVARLLVVLIAAVLVPRADSQTVPASQPASAAQAALAAQPSAATQAAPATKAASPAQSAPKDKAKMPTLLVNSDEVSLDLVVHNKKKKLVTDLQSADIAVTDNGTPVTLHDLHLVSGVSPKGHLITLVFDPMIGAAGVNAAEIANKIIHMLPATGFKVAVLSLGSRLRLIQDFTGDSELTSKAIHVATDEGEGMRGGVVVAAEKNLIAVSTTGVDTSSKLVDIKNRALAKTLLEAIQGSQRIIQDQHTRPALAGLLALARSQQQLDERKTVVYFAMNGQMDTDALRMVHTIVGAANRANVSMFTVDMTGIGAGTRDQLMSMMAMGPISGVNPVKGEMAHGSSAAAYPGGGAPSYGPSNTVSQPPATGGAIAEGTGLAIVQNSTSLAAEGTGEGLANGSPLLQLAAGTGAAYIDGQDSVKKPLAQMLSDMTTYYQATYTPPPQAYDGSFRVIGVKPVRAGLVVRSKTGYFSVSSSGGEGVRPFEAPLIKILSDSQLPTGVKYHASVLRLGDLAEGNTTSLVVEVPLSELDTREDPNTDLYSAHVSIVAQIKDKEGTVVQRFGEDVPRHGSLQSIDQAKSETITLQRHFVAVPGDYFLETAVMDRNNDTSGAQRTAFTIPQPSAGPSLSDMVLVRHMDTYRSDSDSDEPLRFENGKVTPNLSGQILPDDKSVSLFFLLHPDPAAKDQPALEMEVLRDGSPAGHMSLPVHAAGGGGAVPYLANLSTNSLAPGMYDVKARMTQGGKTVDCDIAFTVASSQPAGEPLATPAPDVDAKLLAPGVKPANASELVFTVPDKAVPPPSQGEVEAILTDARQRAVSYHEGLPNFICAEVTNRRIDPSGSGRWKTRDTLVELLKYHDNQETRTMMAVDGQRVSSDRQDMKGTFSKGEFGGLLSAVFQPASKANLVWKEIDTLGTGTVQVFTYRVAKENSDFTVTSTDGTQLTVGFHGQVFIDGATRNVRRITVAADDLPPNFYIRATSIAVDYDYVVINSHDYLMPVAAEVFLKKGRRQASLNQIQFRDYRRMGSSIKILGFSPVETP